MKVVDALLPVNEFSRSGRAMDSVQAIVLHYLGNPGQRAMGARNYWAGLSSQDARDSKPDISASAHYIVDLDGVIYRALPEAEKAYHVGSSQADPKSGRVYTDLARDLLGSYASNPDKSSPNRVCVGIELCHLDAEGRFTDETIHAAEELCADICRRHGLDPRTRIVTHANIVGWKSCPRWMVEHPEYLDTFRSRVAAVMGV